MQKYFCDRPVYGGTLALWLAHKYRAVNGIILINSALTIPVNESIQRSD